MHRPVDPILPPQRDKTTQSIRLLKLQREVLEAIALGRSLQEVLDKLCRLIESMVPRAVATLMTYDQERNLLTMRAHPSLSPATAYLFNGLVPGEGAGSCANAVHNRKPVFVCDIKSDRRWADAHVLATRLGIRACWSVPVFSPDNIIFGTVAITSFEKRRPTQFHKSLLEAASYLAGIAIQRHREEGALRETELRLQCITDAVPGAVYQYRLTTDLKQSFTYISGGMEKLFGISREEILRDFSKVWELIVEDERGRIWESIEASAHSLQPWDESWRIVTPQGVKKWLRGNSIPLPPQPDGSIIWNGILIDITEQKKAEKQLRQALIAFENTTEGVMLTDARCRIVEVNRAFTDITGYSREEALGETPRLLRSERHDEAFYQAMWTSIKESGHWRGEVWNRRKNGEVYPQWLSISVAQDAGGRVSYYVGVFADISRIKESEQRLVHLAHHDALTDLPNRLLFNDRLEHALQRERRIGRAVGLLFLDLDRFKNINDSLGHAVGDELLKQVAERLLDSVRAEDTVARLGGDEFTIILEDLQDAREASRVAEKILQRFAHPFNLRGNDYFVTFSIGISLFPHDGNNVESIVKHADAAMYWAKEHGRNTVCRYTPELTTSVQEWVTLETYLRWALKRDELSLVYQPQVSATDGSVLGVEALVRWHHPQMGYIPPSRFIPMAEDIGLIGRIGEWVLRNACSKARELQICGLPPIRLAVNLSERQINRDFVDRVLVPTLDEYGLPPSLLELEISESFVMMHAERSIAILEMIQEMGVVLAIDDFGSGSSSLAHLKRLPIHTLKIDQSLVRDIPHDPNDEAIARAIVALGHSMGLKVIAEGVETEQQSDVLRREGCDLLQGYLYSRPLSTQELTSYLHKQIRPVHEIPV
jgi:diguanylate cyclase (GGDEF)-like protein/PAS domain S-box-containing protein